MKLSKETLQIFENFADINEKMIIYQGNQQRISKKNWLAEAEITESFPEDVGIYDFKQFLTVYKLFDDPDIDFDKDYIIIKQNKQQVKYKKSNINLIEVFIPKGKKFNVSIDEEFTLSKDILKKIKKATYMFKDQHVSFHGDGSFIYFKSHNDTDKNASFASFEVAPTTKEFKMVIDTERMKLLDHDYRVQISKTKVIQFHSQEAKLNYVFGCEMVSYFK